MEEFNRQLQEIYGIQPDGTITEVKRLTHLDDQQASTAKLLRERIDHLASGMTAEKKAVIAAIDRTIREQAFTILNRFAALRMSEERGFVEECVRGGMQSKGFKVYETVAGAGLGDIYERYKAFLFCLFDEIAVDLGVLFDRFSPYGLLFPRDQALLELLTIINNGDLKEIWSEDETIGWIYQYFNSKEEREAMRKASSAPRNSRELAVRNQFFTPRYVVEFLTDNTLGRIWYEMRQGDTRLKEECRYLVRRPNEIFLKPGEESPAIEEHEKDISQEELFKKPVYIKHRPKKDPRDLKILDPACGSGHFLLYCFDLFENIYEEAYEDPDLAPALRKDYTTLKNLKRDVPSLVLSQNLHGIDIDPRAVQIAALALWLRAQRSYKQLGLKLAERRRVTKTNIVCAEPMPGEVEMLREFTATLTPRVLGQIVEVVFEKMKLADETGSLLKIEEEIRETVAEAKRQWMTRPRHEQGVLFAELENKKAIQGELFDVRGITDEEFWDQAEDRILTALKEYSERAEKGRAVRRRLFAEDTARGFAFIDLCRKRFDAVLMNPPFGDAAVKTRDYLTRFYYEGSHDICAAFVLGCAARLVSTGKLGAITTRLALFLQTFTAWRQLLLSQHRFEVVSDLGYGVLDAMVETAMYTVGKESVGLESDIAFLGLLNNADKESSLNSYLLNQSQKLNWRSSKSFESVLGQPLAYWVSNSLLARFTKLESFNKRNGSIRQGIATADDFRFLRLRWEIPGIHILRRNSSEPSSGIPHWVPMSKGGEYSPWWNDIHLALKWHDNGSEIRNFFDDRGKLRSRPQNLESFFIEGATFAYRTTSAFGLRYMPPGCAFSVGGWGVFPPETHSLYETLAIYNTRIARYFMEVLLGQGDASVSGTAARNHGAEAVGGIPWPDYQLESTIQGTVSQLVELWAQLNVDETCSNFVAPACLEEANSTLKEAARRCWLKRCNHWRKAAKLYANIERSVVKAYGLTASEINSIAAEEGKSLSEYTRGEMDQNVLARLFSSSVEALTDEARQVLGAKRYVVKKAFFIDRVIDLACHMNQLAPESIIEAAEQIAPEKIGYHTSVTSELVSWIVGSVYGRWEVKVGIGNAIAGKLKEVIGEFPEYPPGLLLNDKGQPAAPSDLGLSYPIRVSWDGVLVDDSGLNGGQSHREDIISRIHEVLDLIWKNKAHDIEQEACEILSVSDLHDYFRKPSGFFQDHLKRYSKSRRKAPIYWPLSTASGSYTLWIYYHRLTDQTLYSCVNDYLNLKLDDMGKDIKRLQADVVKGATTQMRQRYEELVDFEQELKDFRDEMLRVAKLPYKPDLNDGVMITAAPLWKLFRHNQWRKDLEACWKKLKAGEYDWAHLAYTIWPNRVKDKCKADLSIAIAHGLEDVYEGDVSRPKKGRKNATALIGEDS